MSQIGSLSFPGSAFLLPRGMVWWRDASTPDEYSGMRGDGWLAEEDLVHSIVGAFYESYNALGAGFLEAVYSAALVRELVRRGHAVQREVRAQVMYKGEPLALQRLDMVVDGRVILEIKSTTNLPNQAGRQLFNYLRASGLQVGLLLHYGQKPRFFRVYCAPPDGSTSERQ